MPNRARSAAIAFLTAVFLTSCASAFIEKQPSFREFSLNEFYDIKKSIQNRKAKQSSKALVEERHRMESLKLQAPRGPTFYGQDHYHRWFDDGGKETWTHVGRPDEFVYDLFFKSPIKHNGTFIEVGAADGVRYSNSLFFEESLGWSGLLVEGATENFLKLFLDRRRKRSKKVYSAICEQKGSTKFVGDGLAAGAVEDMTRHHIESWGHHFKSLHLYDVPCDPLSTLVRRAGLPRVIDFMSIDIEGGEYRALKSFDWKSYKVRVIAIEPGASCHEDSTNVCAELLKQQSFCLVARKAVNEFWVSDPILKQMYCL